MPPSAKIVEKAGAFMYMKTKAEWYYYLIFYNFFLYALKVTQNATAENDISMACKFEPHFQLMLR